MIVNTHIGDVEVESIGKWNAVRKPSHGRTEVWDEEACLLLGFMPLDASPEDIDGSMKLYEGGYSSGVEYGKTLKQHEIRQVLGIS